MKDNDHLNREAKVKFIRENYSNYEKINPYIDVRAIDDIKKLLWTNGFYNHPQADNIMDSVIIRLVILAQKKDPKSMVSSRANKRSKTGFSL